MFSGEIPPKSGNICALALTQAKYSLYYVLCTNLYQKACLIPHLQGTSVNLTYKMPDEPLWRNRAQHEHMIYS